jgi:hypothetical protein
MRPVCNYGICTKRAVSVEFPACNDHLAYGRGHYIGSLDRMNGIRSEYTINSVNDFPAGSGQNLYSLGYRAGIEGR